MQLYLFKRILQTEEFSNEFNARFFFLDNNDNWQFS